MSTDKLKAKYNDVLVKYRKCEAYMDCYHLSGDSLKKAVEERERFIPKVQAILLELNILYKQLKESGVICADSDLTGGFGE